MKNIKVGRSLYGVKLGGFEHHKQQILSDFFILGFKRFYPRAKSCRMLIIKDSDISVCRKAEWLKSKIHALCQKVHNMVVGIQITDLSFPSDNARGGWYALKKGNNI